ncbi:bile acid-transporting ATPase [Microthyrium microscopicum]|uniref:Bile acid-transporting ATPase n=1 Tax=Microthyrium microscopicum TaxID=703497 RepID=A0A6A6U1C0_9PEZI|nr:bile acid-transporting ATPase [Microthyrium microscopicum]
MVGHCTGPVWRRDDLTACFRHDYLLSIFPITICALSILYLAYQIISARRSRTKNIGYQPLNQDQLNGDYVPPDRSRFIDDDDSDDENVDDTATDELEDEGYVTLARTRTHDSVIANDKPKGEFFLVTIEEIAVLAQLGIHVAIFVLGVWGKKGRVAAIAQLATWTYIATLATLRLLLSSQTRLQFSRLWYHTTFIYCFMWMFNTLTFRSEIIHPRSKSSQNFSIADFILTSLLAFIAITSRKGNRTVKLEYEGRIQPSKEQIASVLSLASFSWCDPLIYQGYKKPLEMADVWNVPPRDKAANILADFRQLKKTVSLAFHLLRYFKRSLIIQAIWAALQSVLDFAPTLLLKAILEYVERPQDTPRNAAWLYVGLLFVTGCVQAVAAGQALWIGRKMCIRLRAIVVGEIYAKALKRRAFSTTNKVLGAKPKEPETRPGFLSRLTGLGKKKPLIPDSQTSQNGQSAEAAAAQKKTEGEEAEAQVSSGTIINLMSVDSFKVAEISAYLHFLWASAPVLFIGTIGLLYRILGFSSFVGILMMFLLLPVNMIIAKQFAKLQKQILQATDARIHITNEVLSNIRIIKFFAWEQKFMSKVDEKRNVEIKAIFRRYFVWACAGTVWSGSPILITLLTFMVYTQIEKKDLVPSVAFTALSLFQLLRVPLDQLADMIAHVQESKVSIDRVEEYLNEPETDKSTQLKRQLKDEHGNPLLGFEKANFSWGLKGDKETDAFKLIDLDLLFPPDRLSVIVGPTGSGKTSLLMALLGEMTLLTGEVHLPGIRSREDLSLDPETGLTESIAYCAQQAWLVNASIKDNIVFASPWNPDRYKDVLVACSLQRDLEILDGGDETLVGEKGVTLSGGQKQRISLARALYSRARHVLLDDILSAVDAHTAKWIFEQAILGPLMRNRTCILVTHSVTLSLPFAEFVVVLENGQVTSSGSPKEVTVTGKLSEDDSKSLVASQRPSRIPSRVPSGVGEESMEETVKKAAKTSDTETVSGKPKQPDQEEDRAIGSVKFGVIMLYLAAMGSWFYWTAAGLVFVGQQAISVLSNVWIREWSNAYAEKEVSIQWSSHNRSVTHISGISRCFTSGVCGWSMPYLPKLSSNVKTLTESGEVNDWYYVSVYAIIGLVMVIMVFVREIVLFYGSITASKRIHTQLMDSVMRAKFRFFDSTPLGQIMNRFSKDIEAIDQDVTPVAVGVIYCLLSIVTIIILITVITPGFLIAGGIISVTYFAIGIVYINSSRDLKRLESVKRSPIFQQFGETLTGMTTIRAYADERRFIRENLARINVANRPFIFLWAANRWLAFRVDVIGSLVSFFSGAFVVLSAGKIDPGAAGLAMTYAVTYTENMLWFVRLYASNEQNMNSVERIKEYLDVEREAPPIIEDNRPPGNWPSHGSVEFIGYSTRYRKDFELVLKQLTFKILAGEKVGIVGRTGAGKSSMALALFRALEAEEGKILIDNVDIGLIGLQDLRENVVMVPQDPTLFSGTIRTNLDPFNLFTDEEIFNSLRRVQLVGSPGPSSSVTPDRPRSPSNQNADSVPSVVVESSESSENTAVPSSSATVTEDGAASSPATTLVENKNIFQNLSSSVSESGSNLSQGQRQLLCLARALLKEPKVLMMDEATASIDHATDGKIQETIRQLQNTTITIAHRLKTIVDYDKVLVLDQGEIKEYGTPWELIEKEGGMFQSMCEQSGELGTLRDIAKKEHEKKTQGA